MPFGLFPTPEEFQRQIDVAPAGRAIRAGGYST